MESEPQLNPEMSQDAKIEAQVDQARQRWLKMLEEPVTETTRVPSYVRFLFPWLRVHRREESLFHHPWKDFLVLEASNYDRPYPTDSVADSILLDMVSNRYLDDSVKAAHHLPRDGQAIDNFLTVFRYNVNALRYVAHQPYWSMREYYRRGVSVQELNVEIRKLLLALVDELSNVVEEYVATMRSRPAPAVPLADVPPEIRDRYRDQLPLPGTGSEPVGDDLPLPSDQKGK